MTIEDCNTSSAYAMNVLKLDLPKCPEICKACIDGRHVFHICNELGDLSAYIENRLISGKESKIIKLEGWAEDDLWLENLLEMVAHVMNKRGKNAGSPSDR